MYSPEFDAWLDPQEVQDRLERNLAEEQARAREELMDRRPVPWGRFSELEQRVEELEQRVEALERQVATLTPKA